MNKGILVGLFLLVVGLYNAHVLVPDKNIVYNYVDQGYQYCKIDLSQPDPRKCWRCCINLAFALLFVVFCWDIARSFGIIVGGVWFTMQAAEVYLAGNWAVSDWPDYFVIPALLLTWWVWEKTKMREVFMRIVHWKIP